MRPIDAVAYTEHLIWMLKNGSYQSIEDAIRAALYQLTQMPTLTLDDPRPQGRWEVLPEDWREQMVGDKCSLCGFEHFGSWFNFCPNCGAKMDKEGNDG